MRILNSNHSNMVYISVPYRYTYDYVRVDLLLHLIIRETVKTGRQR